MNLYIKKSQNIKKFLIGFFIFIASILMLIYYSNNCIQKTYLNFENDKVKKPITIIHLSDLHEKFFGPDNKILIDKIKKENPDLIFITGDIATFSGSSLKIVEPKNIKRYDHNIEYTINVLNKIGAVAPTYLSLGNHEHVFEKFDYGLDKYRKIVKNTGVTLLINEIDEINVKGTKVNILGTDNAYYQDMHINDLIKEFEKLDGVKFVLDHYPTNFALNGKFSYINYDVDYVLSGHEHGGQIRIPFIGGIFAHEEGIFPKYSEGVHEKNNVTLIISRGLGNSTLPIRIFNRPELIVIEIK